MKYRNTLVVPDIMDFVMDYDEIQVFIVIWDTTEVCYDVLDISFSNIHGEYLCINDDI